LLIIFVILGKKQICRLPQNAHHRSRDLPTTGSESSVYWSWVVTWKKKKKKTTAGTLQCLQKEMATYRHWSVSLWRDPDDVSHWRILSPDKTKWRLISATLCGWRRCFVADQLWLMTRIREEEEPHDFQCHADVAGPLSVIIHHQDPIHHQDSIHWGVWPVGKLTESVMDTHTREEEDQDPQKAHPCINPHLLSYQL